MTSRELDFDPLPIFGHNAAPWMVDAWCVGADPEAWFPPYRTGLRHPNAQAAVAVCSGCPVRVACYTYALEHGLEGIWGGRLFTAKKRAALGGAA